MRAGSAPGHLRGGRDSRGTASETWITGARQFVSFMPLAMPRGGRGPGIGIGRSPRTASAAIGVPKGGRSWTRDAEESLPAAAQVGRTGS